MAAMAAVREQSRPCEMGLMSKTTHQNLKMLAHPPEFMALQGLLILQEFISYIIKSSTNSIYWNIAYFIKYHEFLQKNILIVDFFCQAQVQGPGPDRVKVR